MMHREEHGPVELPRIDHGRVGALDLELRSEFDSALGSAAQGPARALVLAGTGSSFSAGVDLLRLLEVGPEYVRRFVPLLERVLRRHFSLPLPVVAALNVRLRSEPAPDGAAQRLSFSRN